MHLLNTLPQRLDPGATPTFTGLLTGDGTAAAPSLSFSADTDTGFYRHSANIVGFGAAGARTLLFGTGGNIFGASTDNLQYVSMPTSGAVAVAAGGTHQNITLTPSGTGVVVDQFAATKITHSEIGGLSYIHCLPTATAATNTNFVLANTGVGGATYLNGGGGINFTYNGTLGFSLNGAGRLLIGNATVDSGALLQVGTNTTTSAGGMVFGTDTFLYRSSAGRLAILHTSRPQLDLDLNGTIGGSFFHTTGGVFVDAGTGYGLTVRTNGTTTALTLSSTQAATFAGNAVVGGGSPAGVSTLTVNYSSATKEPIGIVNSNTGGKSWYVGDGTGTSAGQFAFRNATDSITALVITGTGAGYFAGTISPQSATTASAPAYVKGAMYFDTTLNKLRIGGASAWETVTSV
jgi:hypothetical protein